MDAAVIFFRAFGLGTICYGVLDAIIGTFDLWSLAVVSVTGVFGVILFGAGTQTRDYGLPGIYTGFCTMSVICALLVSVSIVLGIILTIATAVVMALALVDPRLGENARHRREARKHATT